MDTWILYFSVDWKQRIKKKIQFHYGEPHTSKTTLRTCVCMFACFACLPEEVVQVYGVCIRTLRLPVISVMIIGVMRLSYNERAVPDGRFRHHLFQAVFMRTTYPSRCVYFRWSRVHTAVETAVTAPVGVWERCKSRVQLQASEIGEIQAPIAHERRVLSRPDLHQIKDLFLCFLKILTWWGDIPIRFGAISPWS